MKRFKSGSTARKALTIAKETRKLVNKTIENKQVNGIRNTIFVTSAGYDSNTVGDNINVTTRQGPEDGSLTVGSSARIGNTVTLMRSCLDFNFDVAATSEQYNKFRLIVVESTEGAQPIALADVLFTPGQPMSSQYTTSSGVNKRYKIWFDRKFEVNKGHNGSKRFHIVKKYGKTGRTVDYTGSPETPTNMQLTVLCISDSTVAPHPSMEYTVRHTYKDA